MIYIYIYTYDVSLIYEFHALKIVIESISSYQNDFYSQVINYKCK